MDSVQIPESNQDTKKSELSAELRETQDALSRTLAQNERLVGILAALRHARRVTSAQNDSAKQLVSRKTAPKSDRALLQRAHTLVPKPSSRKSDALRKLEKAEEQHKALLKSIRALRASLLDTSPQASLHRNVRSHKAGPAKAHDAATADVTLAKQQQAELLAQVAKLEGQLGIKSAGSELVREQDLLQLPSPPIAVAELPSPATTAVVPDSALTVKKESQSAYRTELAAAKLLAQAKR